MGRQVNGMTCQLDGRSMGQISGEICQSEDRSMEDSQWGDRSTGRLVNGETGQRMASQWVAGQWKNSQ